MDHKDCIGSIEELTNGTAQINYCLKCGKYQVIKIDCPHIWTPIKFEISNGSFQIRKYCKLCHDITTESEPKKNYIGIKLPIKNLEKYHIWYENKFKDDAKFFNELKSQL